MEYIVTPEEGTFSKKPCNTYIVPVPDPCLVQMPTPCYGTVVLY